MSYSEDLAKIVNVSVDEIIRLAQKHVPASKKYNPWIGLGHGVKLLSSDDELVQYLSAYGSMHREKLNVAFDAIQNIREYSSKDVVIIDWGCGQGLATMCYFDYMRKMGIEPNVAKICLVEPSMPAIKRAQEHLSLYTSRAQVVAINKYINDVECSDIVAEENKLVVHLFSNILDIESVNLEKLSCLINDCIEAEQLFICVGPQNAGASRIAEFTKLFDIEDEDLIARHDGHLAVRGTISMIVFRIESDIKEVIKVEYYRSRRIHLGNCTAINRVLKDISPSASQSHNTLQFYKAVVDLERIKSANITDVFYYPLSVDTTNNCRFNIDIQDNEEFEQLFLHNANPAQTKWPKNLNIGLSILWDNTIYRILECVYPFEDLKSIDITTQYISVDLAMFSVNADVADKLELTDDVVDVINDVVHDNGVTLHSVESILRDAISHNITIEPQLSLALTAEAPALSQTKSELNSLLSKEIGELMTSFLAGKIRNNVADNVDEDELISVVKMDDSQRVAIATALNSKISVITGPPGTGKTQMIVNLLANAMLKGKRVLVASKNNKAVDNIKERFDQIDEMHSLLRFGSREVITSSLIPFLDSTIAGLSNIEYNSEELTNVVQDYNLRRKAIYDAKGFLRELVRLSDAVPVLEQQLCDLAKHKENLCLVYQTKIEELRSSNSDIVEVSSKTEYDWDSLNAIIRRSLNILQSKNGWFGRVIFNLFFKGKYSAQILNESLCLPNEIRQLVEVESGIRSVADIQRLEHLIKFCEIELRYIDRIISYKRNISELKRLYSEAIAKINTEIDQTNSNLTITRGKIDLLTEKQDMLLDTVKHAREYMSSVGKKLLNTIVKSRITTPGASNRIARYKNYLPDSIPWRRDALPQFISDANDFVDVFRLNSVTSLSVKGAYPLESEFFDMVIIDEASQCDVASALPLLYRAKQIVVIGDPLQLKHITSTTQSEESAIKAHLNINENPFVRNVDYSLWDYCNDLITSADSNCKRVMLDRHYRCHPQIIGYSNGMFYQRKLGTTLKVDTQEHHPEIQHRGIIWVDVVGTQRSETKNVNDAEVDKSIALAKEIAQKYPNVSIGIISPFRHQAEEINKKLPAEYRDRIVVDTVHKFQGDERDVIIYTLVVTNNSPQSKIQWIDRQVPYLVNVAVTRARSVLYVVGNRQYIKTYSNRTLPLGYLAEYTENESYVINANGRETIIFDTNVFIDYPNILCRIDESKQIVVPAKVVDELDKLKVTLDDAGRRNAAIALKNINAMSNRIRRELSDTNRLPIDFNRYNSDNMILSVAVKFRNQNPILITSDNGLQVKAKTLGIETKRPSEIFNAS